jgi:hypothetical protein
MRQPSSSYPWAVTEDVRSFYSKDGILDAVIERGARRHV